MIIPNHKRKKIKMKNRKLTLGALLLGFSAIPVAQAGVRDIGNGGDAVVCYTDANRKTITSIELFYHWEMSRIMPIQGGIQLGAPSLSVPDKIALATERMAIHDPELANVIRQVATSMANGISSYLVTGAELPEIDDTNPRLIPGGTCYMEQFAVQW